MNKKQPKPIIKPFAKDMAKEFFKVGIKEWIEESGHTVCHEIVATVNLAFAAEVCMKAELECNRDLESGHDLNHLYDQLNSEIQDQIFEKYKEFSGECNRNQFEKELEESGLAFEIGRYFYEGDFEEEKILQTSFILNFSTAVLMALQGVSMQDLVELTGYQFTKEDLFELL